jgi:hypothetical protein
MRDMISWADDAAATLETLIRSTKGHSPEQVKFLSGNLAMLLLDQFGNLEHRDFRGAPFEGTSFLSSLQEGGSLRGTDFRDASLYSCSFENVNLQDADFRNAQLRDCSGFLKVVLVENLATTGVTAAQVDAEREPADVVGRGPSTAPGSPPRCAR